MKRSVFCSSALVLVGFGMGLFAANFPLASATHT